MNPTLLNFIQITYSTALPLVLAYIVSKINKITSIKDASKEADMLVLRVLLIEIHDRFVPKGEIPRSTFQTFEEIWKLYHEGYGGNTLTDRFHEEVKALNIV